MKGNMHELRLRRRKFPYQYQPLRSMTPEDRILQKEEGWEMPRPTTETADPPEHETESTESTPLQPQRSLSPREMKIQPPESTKPEQDQQTKNTNEKQQKQRGATKTTYHRNSGKREILTSTEKNGEKKEKTSTDDENQRRKTQCKTLKNGHKTNPVKSYQTLRKIPTRNKTSFDDRGGKATKKKHCREK